MKQFLVQCVPQRGFTQRRRSGMMFTAQGVLLDEDRMTDAIRSDPGLRVIEIPEGAKIVHGPEAHTAVPAGAGDPGRTGREGARKCAYLRANGQRCKSPARGGSEFCGNHQDDESGGASGASVTELA